MAIAAGIGAFVWLAIVALSGRREAWDSPLYFSLGLPAVAAACFALGWRFRRHAWRWGVAAMTAQLAVLLATASDLGLFPLGVVMFVLLAVPCALAGMLGAWAGRRWGDSRDSGGA